MSEPKPSEYAGPQAVVREIDGQLVLDDPIGLAVARAVEKHHCRATFDANTDRIEHFKDRVAIKGLCPDQVVIVVINVDIVPGGELAEALMPGHDWQQYRDQGMVPFARGLAGRAGMAAFLEDFDKVAADKLAEMPGLCVVVVDHGVAEIFRA